MAIQFSSRPLTKQTTSPSESVTTHCFPVSATPQRTGGAGKRAVHNDQGGSAAPGQIPEFLDLAGAKHATWTEFDSFLDHPALDLYSKSPEQSHQLRQVISNELVVVFGELDADDDRGNAWWKILKCLHSGFRPPQMVKICSAGCPTLRNWLLQRLL